jgi:hypothetical protein
MLDFTVLQCGRFFQFYFNRQFLDMYVGFEVFTAVVMKSIIFWDVKPCSLLSCLPPAYLLVLLEFSSTMKMEEICCSEMSVASQQTTRRHNPEDDTLHVCIVCVYIYTHTHIHKHVLARNFVSMHQALTLGLWAVTGCTGVTMPVPLLDIIYCLEPAVPLPDLVQGLVVNQVSS